MSGLVSFLLGVICGTWIPEMIRKGRAHRRPERVTNVFAVLPLIYCAFGNRHTHEAPLPTSITYNVSLLRWEAGCAVCDRIMYGATPHEAAQRWNEYAMKATPREAL